MAPLLFITVMKYVSKRSAEDFGLKEDNIRTVMNKRREYNLKILDDIDLLENDSIKTRRQLDALKHEMLI